MDLKTPVAADGFVFRPYNAKKTTRKFASVSAAATAFGLRDKFIKRVAESGVLINNTRVVIGGVDATGTVYRLYKGRKVIGTFPSFRQVSAASNGAVSAKVAKKMFDEGFSLNGLRVVGR